MAVITKPDIEAYSYKTVVSISSSVGNPEFRVMLKEELGTDRNFSFLSNQPVYDSPDRIRNFYLTTNHAFNSGADMMISVNFRNRESFRDYEREEVEKIDKPVVSALSRDLLMVTALCKDEACIKKFPASMEQSILKVLEELSDGKNRKISLESLQQKLASEERQQSHMNHGIRRMVRHTAEDKIFVEIEVFVKKDETVDKTVNGCATIIHRLHDYSSSKKRALLEDPSLLLK